MRSLAAQALEFVEKVYIPDLLLVASHYKEWAGLGRAWATSWPMATFHRHEWRFHGALASPGHRLDKNLGSPPSLWISKKIEEYVTHSWYSYGEGDGVGKHPWDGETQWNFTGPQPPYDF